jgi:hypothetical protein
MKRAAAVLRILIGVAGAIQLALGALLWSGNADAIVPVHVTVGLILVLSLWALAIMALIAGVARGLAAVTVIWGLVTPALGLAQTSLVPGASHWVIQVIHLLVGLTAIALGQILAAQLIRAAGAGTRRRGESGAIS